MPRRDRPYQKPQPRTVFGRQLQPPKDAIRDFVDPAQGGGNSRATERLLESPHGFLKIARTNDDRALEIEPQRHRRWRIKLSPVVDHDQRTAGLQSLHRHRQRQSRGPHPRSLHNPLDDHPRAKSIDRKQRIETRDASRIRRTSP